MRIRFAAVFIQHDEGGDLSEFNPSSVKVDKLNSVKDRNDWNDTILFNLLHFFRNFTAHRSLIACKIKVGYLNLETREFKPTEPTDQTEPWIPISKGAWILVPELSHLRQKGRKISPTFYLHPLSNVCSSLLTFVKIQRHNIMSMLDHKEEYPYVVNWSFDGFITFKKNHRCLGKCKWEEAHLWPVVRTSEFQNRPPPLRFCHVI